MKYSRIQEMEAFIRRHKTVSNEELQEKFSISIQTLRRDLKELEDRQIINKVYGGVVVKQEEVQATKMAALSLRSHSNVSGKQKIGMLSADLVKNGDVIFVDSGTTAYNLIPFLSNKQNVTVVSHSLNVMNALIALKNVTGICLGGKLRVETNTFVSDTSFYPYYYNKAFIATVGISISKGFTNTDYDEGIIKKHALQNANEVYILADCSKFNVVGFNRFAGINQVKGIITDKEPSEEYVTFLKNQKINLIY